MVRKNVILPSTIHSCSLDEYVKQMGQKTLICFYLFSLLKLKKWTP